jgi:hypothetical protein
MKKYTARGTKEEYITFGGVEYAFLVGKKKIGIRRMDQNAPEEKVVDKLTEYLKAEGWAEHLLHPMNDEETF